MKESVLYPYPFPCYLVDKETFKIKVQSDVKWLKDTYDHPLDKQTSDLVQALTVLIRFAVNDQQRIYFNWTEQAMYIQEDL